MHKNVELQILLSDSVMVPLITTSFENFLVNDFLLTSTYSQQMLLAHKKSHRLTFSHIIACSQCHTATGASQVTTTHATENPKYNSDNDS